MVGDSLATLLSEEYSLSLRDHEQSIDKTEFQTVRDLRLP